MTRRGLVWLVLAGLAASVVVLGMRARLEARYRMVEIVLDGDDWTSLIRREGLDQREALLELGRRGAVSVALSDPTLKRLAEDGKVGYLSGGALASAGRLSELREPFRSLHARGGVRPDALYVTAAPAELEGVVRRLRLLLGGDRVRPFKDGVEVLGTQADLEELGLGFLPEDAAAFRSAGLEVVLRPRNYRGLTPNSLAGLAEGYAAASPSPTLVFAQAEVGGYEGLLELAASHYGRIGARYGRIEVFTARRKQRGEDRLTALMRPSVIRVFSITPEELLLLRPAEAADKFIRAAAERNIRLLYVRPMLVTPAGRPPIEVNMEIVERVARGLRSHGFALGRSRPLPPLEVPAPLLWAAALGGAGLGMLVVDDLGRAIGMRLPRWAAAAVPLAAAAATAVAAVTPWAALWLQLLALGVAVAGATGAVVWALPPRSGRGGAGLWHGPAALARAAVLACAAGIFVAALLSRWEFMLAFSTFMGVKVAHLVPPLLVVVLLALPARPGEGWAGTARDLRRWVAQPLTLGAALAVLLVCVAAVVLLARTGNISIPLVGVEQKLRSSLETLLVARPRTKEFLVGYPALVLAGLAASRGWQRSVLLFAALGAIGTAGAINSFSHLHTPIYYTFWRTGNALLLGALIAAPVALVLHWLANRPARSS